MIIQCIWSGCRDHFGGHDKFKEHLKEVHNVGQDEINNFEISALKRIYSNSEKYYVTFHSTKYAQVLRYWQVKRRCLFKNCNFPNHNALDNGLQHVEYFI
jgi:hypothetical protein